MKIWKKNIVAAGILVTVCAGIYSNWAYTEEKTALDLTETLNQDKILSSDMLVMADGGTLDMQEAQTTAGDYFAAVRLSRQEARDGAVTILQEAMAYGENQEMTETNAELEEIVQTALCEAQIESLVIAKGYTDCVAYITDGGVSVAVASPEGGLQQEDVAVIADIVITQAAMSMDKIRVVEVM